MSFTSEIKEELNSLGNLANKELVRAELIGYLISSNCCTVRGKIKFSTENEYNINRFGKLLSNLGESNYKIELQGKIFIIKSNIPEQIKEIKIENGKCKLISDVSFEKTDSELIDKAIIRGAFLGSGTVNNPENQYHLEIIFSSKENAVYAKKILIKYGIELKELERNDLYSLYVKTGEEMSNIFAFIGANKTVLKFEEIRVLREMRNNVNRQVNCETANLSKTISASVKQIDDIKYIMKRRKMDMLSEPLQEIAKLRIENPNATLSELGEMLRIPLGKSGVNHRLKSIEKFANELRED